MVVRVEAARIRLDRGGDGVHDIKGIPSPRPAQTGHARGQHDQGAAAAASTLGRSWNRTAHPVEIRDAQGERRACDASPRSTPSRSPACRDQHALARCRRTARAAPAGSHGGRDRRRLHAPAGRSVLRREVGAGAGGHRRRGASRLAPPRRRRSADARLHRLAREHGAALAPLHAATVRLYRRWGWEVCSQTLRQIVQTAALTGLLRLGERPDQTRPRRRRGDAARTPRAMGRSARSTRLVPLRGVGSRRPGDAALRVRLVRGRPAHRVRALRVRASGGGLDSPACAGVHLSRRSTRCVVCSASSAARSRRAATWCSCTPRWSTRRRCCGCSPSRIATSRSQGFLCWMQRIVDIDAAMTARGWPARAAGRVGARGDRPGHRRRARGARGRGGSARVTPGGSGAIRCGIGALSAWYSSALRAQDAVRLGLLEGDATAVSAMDGLIAGRPSLDARLLLIAGDA